MTNNTVLFDPGYAKHISSFLYLNEQVKASLKVLKTPQQRTFRYKQFLPQILEVMKKEVGFYYGCLLWAAYIKYSNELVPKEISGNSFYGRTREELEQYDYLQEVNYLLEFFKQYPKDLSYYRVSGSPIEEKYIKTVEIYKEFLTENESFINVKTTAELKLPDSLKILDSQDLLKLKSIIDLTVKDGDFERLYEFDVIN